MRFSQTDEGLLQIARLALMAVLMLVLQYTTLLRKVFSTLGQFQSIPYTVVFLLALLMLLMMPRSFRALLKRFPFAAALGICILIVWIVAAVWAYFGGSTIAFPDTRIAAIVVVIVGLMLGIGMGTRRDWLFFLAIGVFLTTACAFYIFHNPFDRVFAPGSPLWNVRNAILRLQNGKWPYEYEYGLSLAYWPFLLAPFLPFGLIGLDLRWVSLLGALAILGLLYSTRRQGTSRPTFLMISVVFLSPAFIYNLLTTQVVVYWFYLMLFIVFVEKDNLGLQRSGLLIACLSRQLSWPLLLPWLVMWKSKRDDGRICQKNPAVGRIRRWLREYIGLFKPSAFDVVALGSVLVIFLVSPLGFLWSTFTLAAADAFRAIGSRMPQPSTALALTPLLPFSENPYLVLALQASLVLGTCYYLWRTGSLQRFPSSSLVWVYAVFLSINFIVYDYYWIDVIVMALAVVWLGPRTDHVSTAIVIEKHR